MFNYKEFIQLNSSHFQNYTPTYYISTAPESKCFKKKIIWVPMAKASWMELLQIHREDRIEIQEMLTTVAQIF